MCHLLACILCIYTVCQALYVRYVVHGVLSLHGVGLRVLLDYY